MDNNSNTKYIAWTDTQVTAKCASILYDFKDFAKYYAFAYTSYNIENLFHQGNYLELGQKGDNISSIVCFGNNNLCICFLNTETRDIVRQMTINYFMLTGIVIDENILETNIILHLQNDIIRIKIPTFALGTKLHYQKKMKQNIINLVSSLNKIEK